MQKQIYKMIPRNTKISAAAARKPGESGRDKYKYTSISNVADEDEEARVEREARLVEHLKHPRSLHRKRGRLFVMSFVIGFLVLVVWALL